MMSKMFGVLLTLAVASCADDGMGTDDHENEQVTRVELTFTPDGGGAAVVAAFNDEDGDGGMSGTTDPITLAQDTTYTLTLAFANQLVDPVEDITAEIEEEAEEHQVLVYGDAVVGPATTNASALLTHAYADVESDHGGNAVGEDLPVGLVNTITTMAAGEGELRVMLRHLPDLDAQPVKTAGLAESFAAGDDLPGDVDADVEFDVSVQ
jgi:hypothetical protein